MICRQLLPTFNLMSHSNCLEYAVCIHEASNSCTPYTYSNQFGTGYLQLRNGQRQLSPEDWTCCCPTPQTTEVSRHCSQNCSPAFEKRTMAPNECSQNFGPLVFIRLLFMVIVKYSKRSSHYSSTSNCSCGCSFLTVWSLIGASFAGT